jgi:hypothetical protein
LQLYNRGKQKAQRNFLNRCKTTWYELLRMLRTKYTTDPKKAAQDDTRNECLKCMFICGMRNDIRMALESIAGNTNSLETALAAAVQYELAMNTGAQKQGGAQRYGVAALEITGSSAASAPSSAPGAAGMQEMKHELAAILSALATLRVQKKDRKPKTARGRPTKRAEKASTSRHGRQGRCRTLHF